MIIGDNEGVARLFPDGPDAVSPGREFLGGVKIVVALMLRNFRIVGEPRIVAAAVQANVANRGSDLFRGLERAPDHRLIDVAESRVMLAQKRENVGIVPRSMAHLHRHRLIAQTLHTCPKLPNLSPCAPKR